MRQQWDKEELAKKENARLAPIDERRRALAEATSNTEPSSGAARRIAPVTLPGQSAIADPLVQRRAALASNIPRTTGSRTAAADQPPASQPGKTTTASYWPVSGAATTLEARVRQCWEEDVRSFYLRNNPAKLKDPQFLAHLFEKYKGREHDLLANLEKKYKKPL
jgi:hypothetical protein